MLKTHHRVSSSESGHQEISAYGDQGLGAKVDDLSSLTNTLKNSLMRRGWSIRLSSHSSLPHLLRSNVVDEPQNDCEGSEHNLRFEAEGTWRSDVRLDLAVFCAGFKSLDLARAVDFIPGRFLAPLGVSSSSAKRVCQQWAPQRNTRFKTWDF